MANFFGIFMGVMASTILISRIFLSSRVLQPFGVRVGLLTTSMVTALVMVVLALSVLFGYAVVLAFWMMVITQLLARTLYASIYEPAFQLLYQPLGDRRRLPTQAMVEGIVRPVAVGVAGVTLSLDDASSLAIITSKLTSPHPPEVIYALDLLEQGGHPALPRFLMQVLDHPDPDVLYEGLQRIERLRVEEVIVAVRQRAADATAPQVQAAALRAWCALGSAGSVQEVLPYIEAEDTRVRLGAVVGLLCHGGIVGVLAAGRKLLDMVESPEPGERALAARVLGEVGVASFYQPLQTLLQDDDCQVVRAALVATAQLRPPELWGQVVQVMLWPQARRAAATALVAGGEAALTEIEAAFGVWTDEPDILSQLAQICGRIGGQKAVGLLQTQVNIPDEPVRTQILSAMSRCGYHAPADAIPRVLAQIRLEVAQAACTQATLTDLDGSEAAMHFFQDVLAHRLDQQRQRIFYLLSFLYDAQTVLRARHHVHHASATLRAYALEVPDIMLDQELKRLVFPLLHELTPRQRLEQLQARFPQPRLDPPARLQAILAAPAGEVSAWLKACALYVVGAVGCESWTEAVQAALGDGHPLVQETAAWALHRLQSVAALGGSGTVPTQSQAGAPRTTQMATPLSGEDTVLSTIEQVLFLRSVELFKHIPSEDLAQVAHVTHAVRFALAERFIQHGDVGDGLYLIIDGAVDVVVEGAGTAARRSARDVIGEMALLTDSPRTASCVAASDVLALKIERDDFQALMHEKPELALGIIKVLVQRLEEASQYQR